MGNLKTLNVQKHSDMQIVYYRIIIWENFYRELHAGC